MGRSRPAARWSKDAARRTPSSSTATPTASSSSWWRRAATDAARSSPAAKPGEGAGLRRDHHVPAGPEADAGEAFAFGVGGEEDLVAVFEVGAGLPAGKREGVAAAVGDLQQAAVAPGPGAGDRAGSDEVAGLEVAAVGGVVGDHLGEGPVE